MTSFDRDVTTWSPQGRLLQLEYACEAVEQGSVIVGMVGEGCGVLAALQRRPHDLAGYQNKILKVDDHVVMGFSGLSADARKIHKTMMEESIDHRYVHGLENGIPPLRLAQEIASNNHWKTVTSSDRPVGVGVFILGIKDEKSTLAYMDPKGNCFDYVAFAIGKRCQSARTYLENKREEFENSSDLNDLIQHTLTALNNCRQNDIDAELNNQNTIMAVVNADGCTVIKGDDMDPFLESIEAAAEEEEEVPDDEQMEDVEEQA